MIFGMMLLGLSSYGAASEQPVISIDLDLSRGGIDSVETTDVGSVVTLAIRIENVTYLDTYGFQVGYDRQLLSFLDAVPEDASNGIVNILETGKGLAIGFIGKLSPRDSGLVTVANSLSGSDSTQSPSGGGYLALIRFRAQAKGETLFRFDNVELLDWNQDDIPVSQANGARLVILDRTTSFRFRSLLRKGTQERRDRPEVGWLGQRFDLRGRKLALQ